MTSGADIQLDKGGFTRVHNLILEQLAQADMGRNEFKCVMFLLRQTYGYQRKESQISMAEWAAATGLDRGNVGRALRNLVEWGVVLKTNTGNGRGHKSTYAFNKYFEQWRIGQNSVADDTVSEGQNGVAGDTVSGDKQCQKPPLNSVKNGRSTTSLKKERKQVASLVRSEFVAAYEHIWGLTVSSPYIGERITEWETRVTVEGWRYALEECVKGGKTGKWKYLEGILGRIEREGVGASTSPAATPAVINFVWEDIR